jgi:hypothetical protein
MEEGYEYVQEAVQGIGGSDKRCSSSLRSGLMSHRKRATVLWNVIEDLGFKKCMRNFNQKTLET